MMLHTAASLNNQTNHVKRIVQSCKWFEIISTYSKFDHTICLPTCARSPGVFSSVTSPGNAVPLYSFCSLLLQTLSPWTPCSLRTWAAEGGHEKGHDETLPSHTWRRQKTGAPHHFSPMCQNIQRGLSIVVSLGGYRLGLYDFADWLQQQFIRTCAASKHTAAWHENMRKSL